MLSLFEVQGTMGKDMYGDKKESREAVLAEHILLDHIDSVRADEVSDGTVHRPTRAPLKHRCNSSHAQL